MRSFKVIKIADAHIIIDIRNSPVTFWNTFIKPYYYYPKNTHIKYLKRINDLEENLPNKPLNKQILMPFDYLEIQRLCQ